MSTFDAELVMICAHKKPHIIGQINYTNDTEQLFLHTLPTKFFLLYEVIMALATASSYWTNL